MFYKQLARRDKAKKVASVYKAGAKHSNRTFLKLALLYDEKITQCYNNEKLNVNWITPLFLNQGGSSYICKDGFYGGYM